jgi:hypothetical protein
MSTSEFRYGGGSVQGLTNAPPPWHRYQTQFFVTILPGPELKLTNISCTMYHTVDGRFIGGDYDAYLRDYKEKMEASKAAVRRWLGLDKGPQKVDDSSAACPPMNIPIIRDICDAIDRANAAGHYGPFEIQIPRDRWKEMYDRYMGVGACSVTVLDRVMVFPSVQAVGKEDVLTVTARQLDETPRTPVKERVERVNLGEATPQAPDAPRQATPEPQESVNTHTEIHRLPERARQIIVNRHTRIDEMGEMWAELPDKDLHYLVGLILGSDGKTEKTLGEQIRLYDILLKKHDDLEAERDRLKSQLSSTIAHKKVLEKDLKKEKDEAGQWHMAYLNECGKTSRLEERCGELQTENMSNGKRAAELQVELDQLMKSYEKISDELFTVTDDVNRKQRLLVERTKELDKVKAELNEREAHAAQAAINENKATELQRRLDGAREVLVKVNDALRCYFEDVDNMADVCYIPRELASTVWECIQRIK